MSRIDIILGQYKFCIEKDKICYYTLTPLNSRVNPVDMIKRKYVTSINERLQLRFGTIIIPYKSICGIPFYKMSSSQYESPDSYILEKNIDSITKNLSENLYDSFLDELTCFLEEHDSAYNETVRIKMLLEQWPHIFCEVNYYKNIMEFDEYE